MALRVALVIDGDATGAKEALEDTARGVEDLGKKAKNTGDALDKLANPAGDKKHGKIEWAPLADDLDKVAKKAPPAADALDKVGEGLGKTAAEAPGAAAGIVNVGNAAGTAGGKLGNLRSMAGSVLAGLAGGLAAGLVAGAISLAAGAFVSYAQEILSDTPRINRDLEAHEGIVKRLKGAWAEAAGGPSSYGNNTRSALLFATQQDVARLRRDLQDSLGNFTLRDASSPFGEASPFKGLFESFNKDVKDGLADVTALRQGIADIAKDLPTDSPWRKYAEDILAVTNQSAQLQEKLQQSIDLYKGLTGDANAAARAIGGSAEKFGDVGGKLDPLLPKLSEYDRLLKSIASVGSLPGLPNTASGLPAGGFASGGYTGHMPADQVAGFVHGREYVFDAATTARIGIGNLDAIRAGVAGYAGGGFVGYSSGTVGQASGGWTFLGELARDVSVLRGSLSAFGQELARSHNVLAALASTVQSVSERFLDFAFRALDNAFFGNGSSGGLGLVGNLFGLNNLNAFPAAPGAIGVGLYHSGGDVGAAVSSRSVSPSVFIGAPRLHGGGWLKPGERPVIAMDGEEIGWPDQLARKYGSGTGGTVVNNFNIETPNPKAFAESRSTVARAAGRLAARSGRFS